LGAGRTAGHNSFMRDTELLQYMMRLPGGKANLKQLSKELRIRPDKREELERNLERLVERGDVLELRSGQYTATARSREYTAGRISVHREGYAFLVPDKPIERLRGDIFIPQNSTLGAMHGDRGVARISRIEHDGRADGEIVKILKRAHPEVVGEFRITRRGFFVVPHDERLRDWIEIPLEFAIPEAKAASNRIGAKEIAVTNPADMEGMIVNAQIVDYADQIGTRRQTGPVGRIVEILGKPDDFGIDVEIMIRKHHLPHHFPPEVLDQAKTIPVAIPPEEIERRRDFREMPIVTIDGETARDFDDAVWVDRLPNHNYALHVHIADVSYYVKPGSAIDSEAQLRGTSVYFPDRAVPMLPFELSTNVCSLLPRQDRLVFSALLEIDRQGGIISAEFCRGVIRSAERMTYTKVHKLLEGDAELRAQYTPLVERFEMMQELALILNHKRVKRGSIDFDLPEPLIEFDEWGAMTGVSRSPRNIAHKLIEEFMLAANEAVAERLAMALPAGMYRIHEKPDAKRVMDFEEVAAHFGYSLGVGAIPVKKFRYADKRRDGGRNQREVSLPQEGIAITSRHYQKLVAQIEGKPEERILSYLMLRSLKQARYSSDNEGHFALAAKFYTHFTSPIRRYPDLVVHRLLAAVLAGEHESDAAELRDIAQQCSHNERRAAEAERELVEWKKVKFMLNRVGDEFAGLIISVTKYGLFVELTDLFIEGLVPIDALPGDHYMFQENARAIVGQKTRREFHIGDAARVVLDRVDPAEKKLQFSLVEEVRRIKKKKG
jgi:ribonuclease R